MANPQSVADLLREMFGKYPGAQWEFIPQIPPDPWTGGRPDMIGTLDDARAALGLADDPPPPVIRYATVDGLRVRRSGSMSGDIVGYLNRGDQVTMVLA